MVERLPGLGCTPWHRHALSPTANSAGRLDIDTAQVIARITYWSSGECDAEILDVESEQRIYQCSWINLQPGHFDTAFAQWLAIVHGPTAQSLPL